MIDPHKTPPARRAAVLGAALALAAAACTSDAANGPSGAAPGATSAGEAGLAAGASQGPGVARPGKQGARGDAGAFERFAWHDGQRVRSAWLDPRCLADHAPDEASRARLLAVDPDARELAGGGPTVRLWHLGAETPGARAVCAALASGGGRFSPVFRENPSETSPMRSAPGGVLVALHEELPAEVGRERLARLGLSVERELELSTPTFVVASAPGVAALELAEELTARGEFLWATPDWWVSTAAR